MIQNKIRFVCLFHSEALQGVRDRKAYLPVAAFWLKLYFKKCAWRGYFKNEPLGIKGEVWQIEDKLYGLVELCTKVLSDKPLFFLINSYTTGYLQ